MYAIMYFEVEVESKRFFLNMHIWLQMGIIWKV